MYKYRLHKHKVTSKIYKNMHEVIKVSFMIDWEIL